MKEVKLLHLYSDTLDLYGDSYNLITIQKHIQQMGYPCTVTRVQMDEPVTPLEYDLVYIGHGKARNTEAVSSHFCRYGEEIRQAVESGKLFFVTGSARLLFGQSFESSLGQTFSGIGLFDYKGVDSNRVFTSDVVARATFDPELISYGFINRTQHIVGENLYPLFQTVSGASDGEKPDGWEGTLYRNFFGTWQMGPVLVRVPWLLKEVLKRLLGQDFVPYDDSLEKKALDKTLKEFEISQ